MVKVIFQAVRCVNDKHHNPVPHAQRWPAQLVVSIAAIFAGDREACKNHVTADKVNAVISEICVALGCVVTDPG